MKRWAVHVVRTVSRGNWTSSVALPAFTIEASCERDARFKVRGICPDLAGTSHDIEVYEL